MCAPFVAIGACGGDHGELSLVEPKSRYEACNYTLQLGNRIDYSYSATDTVVFEVTWVPKDFPNPIPAPGIRMLRQEGASGHGTLTADSEGVYTFWFYNPDDTTKTPVVVSYSIHSHESWLAEWGLVLGLITAAVIVLVGAGIVVIGRTKRKGV